MHSVLMNRIMSEAVYPFNEVHVFFWFILMGFYGFGEIFILIRNKRLVPKVKNKNRTLLLIMLPFFLILFTSVFEALQAGHKWNDQFFIAGMIILFTGIVIRLIALIQIGKGFSVKVETSDGHELIKTGLYNFIRHPLYLASLCQAVGSMAMLCSVVAWIFLPVSIIGVISRIREEEKFLAEQFTEYEDYKRKTWKIIPFLY